MNIIDVLKRKIFNNTPQAPRAEAASPAVTSPMAPPSNIVSQDSPSATKFFNLDDYRGRPSFSGASDDTMRTILSKALKFGVDPNFAGAVARQESSFDPNAISNDGGYGLYQLTPSANKQYANFSEEELLNPEDNAELALQQLSDSIKRAKGDYGKAYNLYNSGNMKASARNKYLASKILEYMK